MLLGHTPVCAVEIEEYPRKVLLQRQRDGILPRFPIWDDVTTFDGKPWKGKVDVVCGGFPCQDISAAGKGAGLDGDRSGLWSEMARVIREISPGYVFVENSPMLTSRGLGVVLGDLAAMGYDARWCVLGARDVGAKHRRERIWILAYTELQHGKIPLRQRDCKAVPNRQEEAKRSQDGIRPKLVPPGFGVCYGEWSRKPEPPELANGMAYELDELKASGNGQVPQVAATAWSILSA